MKGKIMDKINGCDEIDEMLRIQYELIINKVHDQSRVDPWGAAVPAPMAQPLDARLGATSLTQPWCPVLEKK